MPCLPHVVSTVDRFSLPLIRIAISATVLRLSLATRNGVVHNRFVLTQSETQTVS